MNTWKAILKSAPWIPIAKAVAALIVSVDQRLGVPMSKWPYQGAKSGEAIDVAARQIYEITYQTDSLVGTLVAAGVWRIATLSAGSHQLPA